MWVQTIAYKMKKEDKEWKKGLSIDDGKVLINEDGEVIKDMVWDYKSTFDLVCDYKTK